MKIISTPIAGVMLLETTAHKDVRGEFSRLYCDRELASIAPKPILQINHSITYAVGAVRGLHYQRPPHAEMKFVRCVRGRVWDVAVDLRAGSPTFLQWHAVELSPESGHTLVIPEGCAHGFQTLESDCELLYLHTAHYHPEVEAGVAYNDPALNISWPMAVTEISARDAAHPLLTGAFQGIYL